MATKAEAIKAADMHKCTLIDDGETVYLLASHKHVLACGVHEAAPYIYQRGQWRKGDIWAAVVEELASAPTPCEDTDCEWCEAGDELPYGVDPANVLCGCRVPCSTSI